jgi:hypothetical protein
LTEGSLNSHSALCSALLTESHHKDLNGLFPRFQPESEVGIWRLAEAKEGSRRKNCASEDQELRA